MAFGTMKVDTLVASNGTTIPVASISIGGAGTITFPAKTDRFLLGNNTFASGTTFDSAVDLIPTFVNTRAGGAVGNCMVFQMQNGSANCKNFGFRCSSQGGFGDLYFSGFNDAGSPQDVAFHIRTTSAAVQYLELTTFGGANGPLGQGVGVVTINSNSAGAGTGDSLQVYGVVYAQLGLSLPVGSRSNFAPNLTFDQVAGTMAPTIYANGAFTVPIGNIAEFISVRPSTLALNGAGSTAAAIAARMTGTANVAGSTAYGADLQATTVGAGLALGGAFRAIGAGGAATGVLVGARASVTTVATTDVATTSALDVSFTGAVQCHFGIRIRGENAADACDYALAVEQTTKVNTAHLFLQRGAGAQATSADFLRCFDATAAANITRIDSSGNMIFAGVGQRFQADFSNAAIASRFVFQTTGTNLPTSITVAPNGAASGAGFNFSNSGTDFTNYGVFTLNVSGSTAIFNTTRFGSGTLPTTMVFQVNSVQIQSLDANGVSIGKAEFNYGYSKQVPTTGFSIQVPASCSDLILDPAGTLATGTVTMPASSLDGQVVRVSSTQIITGLTVLADGAHTIKNAPTTLAAGAGFAYRYSISNTTWYRVY